MWHVLPILLLVHCALHCIGGRYTKLRWAVEQVERSWWQDCCSRSRWQSTGSVAICTWLISTHVALSSSPSRADINTTFSATASRRPTSCSTPSEGKFWATDVMSLGVPWSSNSISKNVRTSNVYGRFEIRRMFYMPFYRVRIRGKSLFYNWFRMCNNKKQANDVAVSRHNCSQTNTTHCLFDRVSGTTQFPLTSGVNAFVRVETCKAAFTFTFAFERIANIGRYYLSYYVVLVRQVRILTMRRCRSHHQLSPSQTSQCWRGTNG